MKERFGTAEQTINAVTFDLDGTLVDTSSEITEAVNRTLADFSMQSRQKSQIEALIGAGAHELMRRLLTTIDPDERVDRAELIARFDQHYADTAGTSGVAYPGAAECLEALRVDGVRLACVTNKELRHARHVLHANGLAGSFELVIGGDSLAWKKPDARVLQYVLKVLGCEPTNAAHVGDSATDLRAARNTGVADWAVPWGYNEGRAVEDDGPSRLFQSLPQIASHVLGLRRRNHAGSLP
ncbi:MAG TPA: phosphoglycolate phosphatase [Rhodanobacter sp.]